MGLSSIELREKSNHSACWRLFNNTYPINTLNKYFHVINRAISPITYQNQVYGMYGMNEDEFNEKYNNYTIRVSLNVPMLIELNRVQAPIGFINTQDAHAIYLDIHEHFDDWIKALSNPFIKREPPPLSDFVDLDDFARCVFEVSRDIVRDIEESQVTNNGLKKWLNITTSDYTYIEKYPSKLPMLINAFDKLGINYGN